MPCHNKQNVSLSGCDALGCDTLSQGRIPWAWKQEVPHYWPARPQGVKTRKLTAVQTSNLITHISKYLQTAYFVFRHPTRVPSAENTFGKFPKWWHVQLFDDAFITLCWTSRYCLGSIMWMTIWKLMISNRIMSAFHLVRKYKTVTSVLLTMRRKLSLHAGCKTINILTTWHDDCNANNMNEFH